MELKEFLKKYDMLDGDRVRLNIWTSHGGTYIARLKGLDEKYIFNREFVRYDEKKTSRSGKHGDVWYDIQELRDGLYEIRNPRSGRYGREGNIYVLIKNGEATEFDFKDAKDYFKKGLDKN